MCATPHLKARNEWVLESLCHSRSNAARIVFGVRDKQMSQGRGREDRQVGGGEGRGLPQEEGEREDRGIPRVTRLRLGVPHRAGLHCFAQMSAAGFRLFFGPGGGVEAGTAPPQIVGALHQEALGF